MELAGVNILNSLKNNYTNEYVSPGRCKWFHGFMNAIGNDSTHLTHNLLVKLTVQYTNIL